MPVGRIERIEHGAVIGRVERGGKHGQFACHDFGSNVAPRLFANLDDVADFLRTHPRSGVRMNPDWKKIACNIYIDGVLLR
ncbi:hypothetical protein PX860_27500 (plasmid) [Agrobacterium leguminum]|uniref:hypothetical protein n=1 Tax=Agrobacterium leguminum TaxID=2792015 RepID=UPI00272A63C6|nr:hypothetical protein [Agrobacterium leguminum]WLE00879.1 hypothetical protein PX860_27500 [Agrobacterium leguminum]